jgi:hypothetical protein
MTVSKETISTINAISTHLESGLDSKSLEAMTTLISCGVHPDALSALILELRREMTMGIHSINSNVDTHTNVDTQTNTRTRRNKSSSSSNSRTNSRERRGERR